MNADATPTIDLGAEAAIGLGEWALIALAATAGLAYLVRGFPKRKAGRCGACAGCDKSGACPMVKLEDPASSLHRRQLGIHEPTQTE